MVPCSRVHGPLIVQMLKFIFFTQSDLSKPYCIEAWKARHMQYVAVPAPAHPSTRVYLKENPQVAEKNSKKAKAQVFSTSFNPQKLKNMFWS